MSPKKGNLFSSEDSYSRDEKFLRGQMITAKKALAPSSDSDENEHLIINKRSRRKSGGLAFSSASSEEASSPKPKQRNRLYTDYKNL